MKTKKPASNDAIMAVPIGRIESSIVFLRGQKVMIDRDLAELYAVSTKRLNEQVKRNITRFPSEFMFQLTEQEQSELVANCDRFIGFDPQGEK